MSFPNLYSNANSIMYFKSSLQQWLTNSSELKILRQFISWKQSGSLELAVSPGYSMIFGKNTFKRSNILNPHFSFLTSECASLSPTMLSWKKKYCKTFKTSDCAFSLQTVFLFQIFDRRKLKERIAEKGNVLDV